MSVSNVHPLYTEMLSRWKLGRDSYAGEDVIKDRGIAYLPQTSGQIADGAGIDNNSTGEKAYQAYKMRAIFPDIYLDAVEACIGIMHRESPTIELPAGMEPMRENCTLLGESLEMLLRKINANQLITGRLGLLGDIRKDTEGDRPVVVIYNELAVRNWDDTSIEDDDVDIRLVVLDESDYEMGEDLTWLYKEKYRVLGLVDMEGNLADSGVYASAVFKENDSINISELESPNTKGTELNKIPFVFVNTKDLSPTPDRPPLDGLAKLCLAIYRGEADYRQNLFMQGQDTLVQIGAHTDDEDVIRTGAGARIDVPLGGDAKYIGVNSQGLPEQRQSLENDYNRAIRKSGQLIDATSRAKESGDALRIRVAAQTATLPQIAKTGAAGLQTILRDLADWYGYNPDEVKVRPNLEFSEADLNGQTLVQMVTAKGLGAKLSDSSIHMWMQDQGFTKRTYEEELELISMEVPAIEAGPDSPVYE